MKAKIPTCPLEEEMGLRSGVFAIQANCAHQIKTLGIGHLPALFGSRTRKAKLLLEILAHVMGKLKAFIFNKEEITGILNELYADLSNEIEFEDFLKASSFSV
ncbi:hypothetical protein SADUNF_Sadunf04G0098600 [Salix dunnii]|uniref:Uncharacterized protein n=1 Tax=Salix dunnii TaxID=1413687 RepID=A0A835KBD5_9ROSI|nr:hypothetical protein SADUNF_Sadunf04G0098600 [Salix dunnii]